jgi:hypothetical protein
MRTLKIRLPMLLLMLGLLALGACAATNRIDRGSALDAAQYAWSAAIRWGDFEGASNMLDPEYRKAHPISDLEFERYKQLQISAYQELGSQVDGNTAMREVQIGVVNRNTLVERDARYTERWRFDPATKTWWVESGLPDLSQSP